MKGQDNIKQLPRLKALQDKPRAFLIGTIFRTENKGRIWGSGHTCYRTLATLATSSMGHWPHMLQDRTTGHIKCRTGHTVWRMKSGKTT